MFRVIVISITAIPRQDFGTGSEDTEILIQITTNGMFPKLWSD